MTSSRIKTFATSRSGAIAGAAAVAAAATALWVQRKARAAEREHPPLGRRIVVDGVGVHYVERGAGSPVVLIHGNTVSLADFQASGLFDRLARNHRVIAIDRPGFGHSDRPRDRLWTPAAQAELLRAALAQLGVDRPAIVAHSMGTLVALSMALNHPAQVRKLVLLSGYHYPAVRVDALLTAPVALPILGDVMRYTVTALAARATLKRVVKAMFAPLDVPPGFFTELSREMMLRPSQIRANAEDATFMMPAAASLAPRYPELRMPITIMAGAADGVVDPEAHSVRLHEDVPGSDLFVAAGSGHMVHYAASEAIVAALTDDAVNDSVIEPEEAPLAVLG
ncbi:alpha/beta hydrolase [Piscinibacter sp. XHJ-5]|uniref:alpha/beta fold hydrolase n=1 Tax=Piscinibacter sp. XHJ-5 TaxID=3037797 RepID=UPI002452CFF5|nr:alpha/beta hydrolase [Piscinibacter sp. XHJ-5]